MTGCEMIAAERQRQIGAKGWTPEHDDEHVEGEIASAAACYAAPFPIYQQHLPNSVYGKPRYADPWPWDECSDKRARDTSGDFREPTASERVRLLAKAGALIAAEIDRIQRSMAVRP